MRTLSYLSHILRIVLLRVAGNYYSDNDYCDHTIAEEERGTRYSGRRTIDDADTGGKINSCTMLLVFPPDIGSFGSIGQCALVEENMDETALR